MDAALYATTSTCRVCGWSIYGSPADRVEFRLRHSAGHAVQSLGFFPRWAKTPIDAMAAIKWNLLYAVADPAHTMTKPDLLRHVAVAAFETGDQKNVTMTLLWINAVLVPISEAYPDERRK